MPTDPLTVRESLELMDRGWADFQQQVRGLPMERLQQPLASGAWTRKQMLGHLATWHDLTVHRLSTFADTGQPNGLDEDEDVVNARAARAAEGRPIEAVLSSLDVSFQRLRREVSKLSDTQLAAHASWAAAVIAGNSYGHYREHLSDLEPPAVPKGQP
ncbi:MAG: DinB family protein [Candidatus Limnocylindrales bacterium]